MDLTPHANDHSIYLPGRTGAAQDSHYHLFYITGNPGCIAYYHTFLTLLQEKVLFQKDGVSLSIYGESLPNFTDQATGPASILSLRQVIAHVGQRLVAYGQAQQKHTGQKSPIKIVISGHSLGTYIGLELLRWWHAERLNSTSAQTINIVGYLGLWCTVTWLNKSPSGRLAKPLINLPGWLPTFCTAAEYLVSPLPTSILLPVVKYVTKFPEDAAGVTCNFLKSRRGIRQALYLARDEFNEILDDRWSDDIWGSAQGSGLQVPNMVFHFGADDHWVSKEVRDDLIKIRGRTGQNDAWKPVMEVDQNGIPHAFCIRHSSLSASIATDHLLTIIKADRPG